MLKYVWLTTIASATILAASSAQADDVYNFYFQKGAAPAKVVQGAPEKPAQEVDYEKEQEEYWKDFFNRKQQAPRGQYPEYQPPVPAAHASSTVTPPAVQPMAEPLRKWGLKFGVGSIAYKNSDLPYGEAQMDTLVLGARYNINKYFDVEMELQVPSTDNGPSYQTYDYDSSTGTYTTNTHGQDDFFDKTEWTLGVGVTPLHIDIFGRETILIGAVMGVMSGKRVDPTFGVDEELSAFIGPRITVNITPSLGLEFSGRYDQSFKGFQHNTVALNYSF